MTAIEPRPAQPLTLTQPGDFTREQIELLKNTVAAGTTDLELALFLEVCKSSGLNPFQKQVYAVVRKSKAKQGNEWVETSKMVIQTGIDGYRLIAARSGIHLGTTDPEFGPVNAEGFPEYARVIVRKLVHGHIAEFPATARWSEYVQTKAEYANGRATGNQIVSDMWKRMSHTMLGKCAEALALRKAFPAELSGVYSDVEMQQADTVPVENVRSDIPAPKANPNALALETWAKKIGDMAARVRKVAPEGEVAAVLQRFDWRDLVVAAQHCYDALKELGLQHAPKKDAPPAAQEGQQGASEAQAETMADADQIKQLQAIARSAGASTSDERAVLWGYMGGTERPIHTKELTSEQAVNLLAAFVDLDGDERKQAMAEARKEAKGQLL